MYGNAFVEQLKNNLWAQGKSAKEIHESINKDRNYSGGPITLYAIEDLVQEFISTSSQDDLQDIEDLTLSRRTYEQKLRKVELKREISNLKQLVENKLEEIEKLNKELELLQ